jgi:hypothetical protein
MHRRISGPYAGLIAIAAILTAALVGAGPASAHDTAGNNGTVKIHERPGEHQTGEVRDDPQVCTFHLHFFFADPEQAGKWEIQRWAPTGAKGTVVLSGTYDTQGDGEDRQPEQGVYQLPDGHYKLFWDGDVSKHDKMKVFWVDCAESPGTTGGGTTGGGTGGTSGGGTTGGGTGSTSGGGTTGGGTGTTTGGGVGSTTGGGTTTGGGVGFTSGVGGITLTPPPTDTADDLAPVAADGDPWPWIAVLATLILVLALATSARLFGRVGARAGRKS